MGRADDRDRDHYRDPASGDSGRGRGCGTGGCVFDSVLLQRNSTKEWAIGCVPQVGRHIIPMFLPFPHNGICPLGMDLKVGRREEEKRSKLMCRQPTEPGPGVSERGVGAEKEGSACLPSR